MIACRLRKETKKKIERKGMKERVRARVCEGKEMTTDDGVLC